VNRTRVLLFLLTSWVTVTTCHVPQTVTSDTPLTLTFNIFKLTSVISQVYNTQTDNTDCFYYYKRWFGNLDWGSMRSNLIFQIRDYRWFAFTSFAFLFRKKKYVKETSSYSKISSRLLAYTYTCVFCAHIRTYVCRDIYAEIWSIRILRAIQVSRPDPWAHNRVPHPCSVCVCVCAYTHTYTHIHSHPRTK